MWVRSPAAADVRRCYIDIFPITYGASRQLDARSATARCWDANRALAVQSAAVHLLEGQHGVDLEAGP
jgi:hypothetical protein